MRRSVLAAALLTLAPGLGTARGWEDPPALLPPALVPPAEAPSPSTEKAPSRPMLVIPGVTAPRPTRPSAVAPTLDGPQAVRPPAVADTTPRPGVTLSPELQPVPPDDDQPRAKQAQAAPASAAGASRRPGVLGRLWGSEGGDPPAAANGITIEPHSDPAVEAAVKRRVEKQIQESLGDRVRDVEVRVKARDILIRAHASHFWHRWSARRTLDALPLPAGYRARVEMD